MMMMMNREAAVEEEEEEEKSKVTEQSNKSIMMMKMKNKAKKEQNSCSNDSSKVTKDSQRTDYIHVRARRGQATDSHSIAERVRERLSLVTFIYESLHLFPLYIFKKLLRFNLIDC